VKLKEKRKLKGKNETEAEINEEGKIRESCHCA
jgi:hypothetical protein